MTAALRRCRSSDINQEEITVVISVHMKPVKPPVSLLPPNRLGVAWVTASWWLMASAGSVRRWAVGAPPSSPSQCCCCFCSFPGKLSSRTTSGCPGRLSSGEGLSQYIHLCILCVDILCILNPNNPRPLLPPPLFSALVSRLFLTMPKCTTTMPTS